MAHSCAPAQAECRLTSSLEPGLLLAPLRLEPVCQEPGLLIIHDLLSQAEVTYMKTSVLQHLQVATVVDASDKSGDGKKISNERTQASGWLFDKVRVLETGLNLNGARVYLYMKDHSLLAKLSKRASLLTNLEMTQPLAQDPGSNIASEAWQVGVYGPGGHYLPHFDAFDVLGADSHAGNIWVGNR